MRQVLHSEIVCERPNKSAVGAYNRAIARGTSRALAAKAASRAASGGIGSGNQEKAAAATKKPGAAGGSPSSAKTSSGIQDAKAPGKTSGYGLQPGGSFVASNKKQFYDKIDAMYSQKKPASVSLKGRDGITRYKIEKVNNNYEVTSYNHVYKHYSKTVISKAEFERNKLHHIQ